MTPDRAEVSDCLDRVDRLLLDALQKDFPVTPRPYETLAGRLNRAHGLDLTEDELWRRAARLRRDGYIRRLGAIFQAAALGYCSTLCAAKAPPTRLEHLGRLVNASPRVTHNYLRSDELNLWFTFTAPSENELAEFLSFLKQESGVSEIHVLPAEKVFKIKVDFKMSRT